MRYIKKYDYSSLVTADLNAGQLGKPYVALVADNLDWNSNIGNTEKFNKYFYITPNGEDITVMVDLTKVASCYYSFDMSTWSGWTEETVESVTVGQKLYFKIVSNYSSGGLFTVSGEYAIGGNLGSIIFGDDFKTNLVLSGQSIGYNEGLFENDTNLVSCNSLVIYFEKISDNMTLNGCFRGCSNLEQRMPYIVVKDVGITCCWGMFQGCTSLTNAPEIIVEKAAFMAFGQMFWGCSNLSNVRCLLSSFTPRWPGENPFMSWLTSVAQTGTITINPNATFWQTDSANGIPSGWTVQYAE